MSQNQYRHQPSRSTTLTERRDLLDIRRLFIFGNSNTQHRQLCRYLTNYHSENNRSYVVFSGGKFNTDYRITAESTQRSINIQTILDNTNEDVTTRIRNNNYNYFFGISDLKDLDRLIEFFPNINDKIVVFDRVDTLFKDINYNFEKYQEIEDLFENQKIIFIAKDFPGDKKNLISRNPFDFAFFDQIPSSYSNAKNHSLVKDICAPVNGNFDPKLEKNRISRLKSAVGTLSSAGTEFILRRRHDETLYKGTVNEDEQSFLNRNTNPQHLQENYRPRNNQRNIHPTQQITGRDRRSQTNYGPPIYRGTGQHERQREGRRRSFTEN